MYKKQNYKPQSILQPTTANYQQQAFPQHTQAYPQYTQAQYMCNLCKNHMYRYVLLHTNDGKSYDGIIEHVDEKNVYLAVPLTATDMDRSDEDLNEQDDDGFSRNKDENDQRQFLGGYGIPGGYPGYVYPGYGYPGYGFPGYVYPGYGIRPRRRRFQRQILPLAALTGLALLPYFF